MNRKVISVVILILIIVVGVLAGLWFHSQGLLPAISVPTALQKYLPVNLQPGVLSPQANPSGIEIDVAGTAYKMFTFHGHFVSKLYTAHDVIMGEFAVDNKTGAPVHVVLTITTGNISYGSSVGNNSTFNLITADNLLTRVKVGTHYELRITVPNPPQNDQDKNDTQSMRNLIQATEIKSKEYTLIPQVLQEIP